MIKHIKSLFIPVFFCILGMSLWPQDIESTEVDELIKYLDVPVRVRTVQKGSFQGILKEVTEKNGWKFSEVTDSFFLWI